MLSVLAAGLNRLGSFENSYSLVLPFEISDLTSLGYKQENFWKILCDSDVQPNRTIEES